MNTTELLKLMLESLTEAGSCVSGAGLTSLLVSALSFTFLRRQSDQSKSTLSHLCHNTTCTSQSSWQLKHCHVSTFREGTKETDKWGEKLVAL